MSIKDIFRKKILGDIDNLKNNIFNHIQELETDIDIKNKKIEELEKLLKHKNYEINQTKLKLKKMENNSKINLENKNSTIEQEKENEENFIESKQKNIISNKSFNDVKIDWDIIIKEHKSIHNEKQQKSEEEDILSELGYNSDLDDEERWNILYDKVIPLHGAKKVANIIFNLIRTKRSMLNGEVKYKQEIRVLKNDLNKIMDEYNLQRVKN